MSNELIVARHTQLYIDEKYKKREVLETGEKEEWFEKKKKRIILFSTLHLFQFY
jgi:hypothetical protein